MRLEIAWHDVECHAYAADLPLWHELAAREEGPILDVGAGTGRVAGDLAEAGHRVVALDRDAALLEELRRRHPDVETVVADAQSFSLNERFGLILVPMQTVQLLGDRPGFLSAARAHLRPGGLLAIAISEDLQAYEGNPRTLPDPDVGERDGWRFVSQPMAVRAAGEAFRIERVRTALDPDGRRHVQQDVIELAALSAETLEREARAAGFESERRREIAPTGEHVGSTVVMLRG